MTGNNNNPKCADSEPLDTVQTTPLTAENVRKAKEMVKKLLKGAKTNEKQ